MSAKLFFAAIVVAFFAATTATQDPLSKCNLVSNKKLAPFIFLSQSELAVLAHYSTVDYNAFRQKRITNFHITPVCYVKGYHSGMDIEVWSGYQKCAITPLSNLLEYPTLFFLRRDHRNNRWFLINSGEYQHRVDTQGLLFGVDRAVTNFPEVCGLKRQRIPVDQSECSSMTCRGYCNFRVATSKTCTKKEELMQPYMKTADIPKDVAPFNGHKQSAFGNYPNGNVGGATPAANGQGAIPAEKKKTTKGFSERSITNAPAGRSITYAPEAEEASNEIQTVRGKNSAMVTVPATGLFLFVALFALCH